MTCRIIVLPVFMGFLAAVTAAAGTDGMREVRFHGIRPMDPGGRDGLRNPERGLRTEAVIGEPAGAPYFSPSANVQGALPGVYSDLRWLLDAQNYESFGLTLAQSYCYLDQYCDKPIPPEKLDCLRHSLDLMRQAGLKALLRFAYEKEMNVPPGPTLPVILNHLDQLAPILRDYADVIYVMQAGFVGAWGEWHSSAHQIEKDPAQLAAVVKKLLEVLPATRMTQVRVPKYKRWVLSEPAFNAFQEVNAASAFSGVPAARIGFHNDGFLAGKTCGGTWTEEPLFSNPGNPEFDYMTRECPYVPVDGELFWSDIDGRVDGLQAAVRMRLHHYSSFSLAHSYSGKEGRYLGMDAWMDAPLSAEQARAAALPISSGYFEDQTGGAVPRTQFEYIRDHLGYRIELQGARFPARAVPGATMAVDIELVNRGFSTLLNPRPVYVVLAGLDGRIALRHKTAADPRSWQPYDPNDPACTPLTHLVHAEVPLPPDFAPGDYLLGVWLPDGDARLEHDARYAVRVANRDAPFWRGPDGDTGVNVLGALAVSR